MNNHKALSKYMNRNSFTKQRTKKPKENLEKNCSVIHCNATAIFSPSLHAKRMSFNVGSACIRKTKKNKVRKRSADKLTSTKLLTFESSLTCRKI